MGDTYNNLGKQEAILNAPNAKLYVLASLCPS